VPVSCICITDGVCVCVFGLVFFSFGFFGFGRWTALALALALAFFGFGFGFFGFGFGFGFGLWLWPLQQSPTGLSEAGTGAGTGRAEGGRRDHAAAGGRYSLGDSGSGETRDARQPESPEPPALSPAGCRNWNRATWPASRQYQPHSSLPLLPAVCGLWYAVCSICST
jgi:hypothetical protein